MTWLSEIEKDLASVMRPHSKSDRLILTEALVEADLTVIAEAESTPTLSKLAQAKQVRNGLMIAMWNRRRVLARTRRWLGAIDVCGYGQS